MEESAIKDSQSRDVTTLYKSTRFSHLRKSRKKVVNYLFTCEKRLKYLNLLVCSLQSLL